MKTLLVAEGAAVLGEVGSINIRHIVGWSAVAVPQTRPRCHSLNRELQGGAWGGPGGGLGTPCSQDCRGRSGLHPCLAGLLALAWRCRGESPERTELQTARLETKPAAPWGEREGTRKKRRKKKRQREIEKLRKTERERERREVMAISLPLLGTAWLVEGREKSCSSRPILSYTIK